VLDRAWLYIRASNLPTVCRISRPCFDSPAATEGCGNRNRIMLVATNCRETPPAHLVIAAPRELCCPEEYA